MYKITTMCIWWESNLKYFIGIKWSASFVQCRFYKIYIFRFNYYIWFSNSSRNNSTWFEFESSRIRANVNTSLSRLTSSVKLFVNFHLLCLILLILLFVLYWWTEWRKYFVVLFCELAIKDNNKTYSLKLRNITFLLTW